MTKKRVLIVEDDDWVMDELCELCRPYEEQGHIVVERAHNAGEALDRLRVKDDEDPVAAVLLDIMMAYGTAKGQLDPDQKDLQEEDTNTRTLEHMRESGIKPWVAVVTARVHPAFLQQIRGLLREGDCLYLKPFDTLDLQHRLACALGIPSVVPPALQPDGEKPEVADAQA